VEADGIICYRDTSFAAYPTSDLRKKGERYNRESRQGELE